MRKIKNLQCQSCMKLNGTSQLPAQRRGELSWKAGTDERTTGWPAWLNLLLDYGQFGQQNVKEENKYYDF